MKEKISFAKKILPLLLASSKSDYNFLVLKKEIDDNVDKISSFLSTKDEDIKNEISFLLSSIMHYEVDVNNNCYIDDMVDDLIYFLKDNEVKINKVGSEDKLLIERNIMKVFTKVIIYHNTMMYSNIINYEKYTLLNEKMLSQVHKIITSLTLYLKENKINDKNIISEMIDIAIEIYIGVVSSYLQNILKNEKEIKDYCSNQSKYIAIFENLFVQQFSELDKFCYNMRELL